MELIHNQPIAFGLPQDCADDFDYKQLVDITDKTQFQVKLTPCSNNDLITDGTFNSSEDWSVGEGWSIADNQLCLTTIQTAETSQTGVFPSYNYYQLTIRVESITGQIEVKTGTETIGFLDSVGDIVFNLYMGTYSDLTFTAVDDNSRVCISYVSAFKLNSNLIVGLYTLDKTLVKILTPSLTVYEDSITATIDWAAENVPLGCYLIGLFDNCGDINSANIQNGEFDSYDEVTPHDWILGENTIYNNEDAIVPYSIQFNDLTEDSFLIQNNVFPQFDEGVEYCIKVTITEVIGAPVNVYFGTNLVGQIDNDDIQEYTFIGVATGNATLTFIPQSGLTSCIIKSVLPCEITELPNYFSEPIKLIDLAEDKCQTLVINACNSFNSFGFVFGGSGFSPRIRLEAALRKPKYTNERTIFEDSVGIKSVSYYSASKQKQLSINLVPEYVHDFLRLLLGFDNVYIENTPYIVEDDEYSVEWLEEFNAVGKVRLLVSEKQQDMKNKNCAEKDSGCQLPPNYLLAENGSDLNNFITLENGELILIN